MTPTPKAFADSWGGAKFKKAWKQLCRAIDDRTPLPGFNIAVNDQPGEGRVLNAQASSSSSTTTKPFAIISIGNNGSGTPMIGVYFYSTIFKSVKVSDNLTITGVLTSGTPLPTDAGGFECPAIGEKIWCKILTADPGDTDHILQPFAASIQYGAAWDGYPDPITINSDDPVNPFQESYEMLIAEVVADSDLRPAILSFTISETIRKIVQIQKTNVILTNWAVNGQVILVPEPWNQLGLAT